MHSLVNLKKVAAALLAGGAVLGAHAAGALSKSGSEYRILPSLPGDQTLAELALGADGGFLVVQDNSIDGNGLGIRARQLFADLSAAQNTFQVNASNAGDQQNARVALLRSGGAVFAWENSTAAGHRIMVRFLGANNVFNAEEVTASRVFAGSQSAPALAVLADGNVIVVWAEWDRDGSMDGVFGQIFTPTGVRSGGTFQVNVKSELSQRNPSVAALGNGGFAVAWVTDENRHSESIDIYARIFAADGTAAGGEFPVNTWKTHLVEGRMVEVLEVCANPFIASIPGGFRVAWSERTASTTLESWDVVTRSFDANGEAQSGEAIVNNVTRGDQFSPKIASAGSTQLIAWTSFGQDGSDEGVYARLLNGQGGFDGDEFRVNTRTLSKQIYPTVSSAGDSRFVVAWSSFVGGVASYDLFAQNFSLTGSSGLDQPGAPFVSSLSQNSLSVTWAELPGGTASSYLVYVDDEPAPTETTQGILAITRAFWQPGSTHTVRIAYKNSNGQVSPQSEAVSVKTWGADANNDGLPDDWQQLNFGKLRPSGKEDTDGDGASNYEEFLAGTDPTDATSVLRASVSGRELGLYIEWNTVPGNYYQLQVTSDFESWANVGTPRFAHSTYDSLPCTGPGQVRYYRVIRMR